MRVPSEFIFYDTGLSLNRLCIFLFLFVLSSFGLFGPLLPNMLQLCIAFVTFSQSSSGVSLRYSHIRACTEDQTFTTSIAVRNYISSFAVKIFLRFELTEGWILIFLRGGINEFAVVRQWKRTEQ